MSKGLMAVIVLLGLGFAFFVMVGIYYVNTSNTSARFSVSIKAKQTDNTSEFDNMNKKIKQTAQVAPAQMDKLKEIFNTHAQARGAGQQGGSLALWIKESVPTVDAKTYDKLMDIITSSRNAWTMRQKEIIAMKESHDHMFVQIPSKWILSIAGHVPVDIVVVTSSATKEAFITGEDNDIELFKK